MGTFIGEDKKNDLQKLTGVWIRTESVFDGERVPADMGPEKIVIAGDQLRVVEHNGETAKLYRIEIDPTKKPPNMDLYLKFGQKEKGPIRGIYSLEGEILKLCHPRLPSQERPTEFSSPKNSKLGLITLKRAKPK
jgi:uncharacterized protein (TIGR03067 family)